jgi:hypothetical protein
VISTAQSEADGVVMTVCNLEQLVGLADAKYTLDV